MIFYDTETCGLHGMAVLIQYAKDDGPIVLHDVWKSPICETLELIEMFMREGTTGFNLTFDHFHLCKLYTTFSEYHDYDAFPEDIIDELAECEMSARDGKCLKPVTALDLMLHARKGPYQSTMDRSDIRIRRVPTPLAWQLATELEKRVVIDGIHFARKKDKNAPHWSVYDITDPDGKMNPDFKDVVLKFAPSIGLKALAKHCLGVNDDDLLLFGDVEVNRKHLPVEYGYAPFAKAVGNRFDWKGAWPAVIKQHIYHWKYSERAREYATRDVDYTRRMCHYFGNPEPGDDDSMLAVLVGAVRWKGFRIDYQGIKTLKEKCEALAKSAPKAPSYVKRYIWPDLSEAERLATKGSTKKTVLEDMAKNWPEDHPAAIKAREVLAARTAQKEIELYDKLLKAGRFHASFKVIGALSSRMSGADKLNPQGIKRTKDVRRCFPLADQQDYLLCGGDFASFEVVIADAVFNDPRLREALLTQVHCYDCDGTGYKCPKCKGKGTDGCPKGSTAEEGGIYCKDCKGTGKTGMKIHALFGESLFPEEDYESIMESKGTDNDLYTKAKSGVFSQLYGGDHNTLKSRLGIGLEVAEVASKNWMRRFPGIGKFQAKIKNDFCSLKQPGGVGTRVVWHDPKEFVESLTGFKRFFTLENAIAKALFQLGENPPEEWKQYKIKVHRRDRDQTALGATRSALFGAAFGIQSNAMRAAANHVIQSTGAIICKRLQRKIYDLQPSGINDWIVQPMNVHDEIMLAIRPEYIEELDAVVHDTVESYRGIVPLIEIDWSNRIKSWADK